MNDAERHALKTRIHEEIVALEQTIRELTDAVGPVAPDVAIGRLSRMDTIQNQSVTNAAIANAHTRLEALRHALVRIDEDPEYGLCEECGDPIAPARLLAMPETPLCVECAA